MNLSVAASHKRLYLCSGVSGWGSLSIASFTLAINSSEFVYVKQFRNDMKKSFDGCFAQITNFPIARASAVVVHRTSLMLGFLKTLYLKKYKQQMAASVINKKKWNTELIIFDNCLKVSCLIRTHGVNYQHDPFP